VSLYGFCPKCLAPSANRERRPNGNDTCQNGHVYPSASASLTPELVRKRMEKENAELRARLANAEQVIADYAATIREYMAAEKAAKATHGEPMAWMVFLPKGDEYDYAVFGHVEDAKQHAELLDADEDEGTEPRGVIPLYADPSGAIAAAERERDDLRECQSLELAETRRLFDLIGLQTAEDFGTLKATEAIAERFNAMRRTRDAIAAKNAEIREKLVEAEKARDEQAEALRQAVASCKCLGTGEWQTSCTLCGDSTFDHHCNDEIVKCDRAWCIAARKALAAAAAVKEAGGG